MNLFFHRFFPTFFLVFGGGARSRVAAVFFFPHPAPRKEFLYCNQRVQTLSLSITAPVSKGVVLGVLQGGSTALSSSLRFSVRRRQSLVLARISLSSCSRNAPVAATDQRSRVTGGGGRGWGRPPCLISVRCFRSAAPDSCPSRSRPLISSRRCALSRLSKKTHSSLLPRLAVRARLVHQVGRQASVLAVPFRILLLLLQDVLLRQFPSAF